MNAQTTITVRLEDGRRECLPLGSTLAELLDRLAASPDAVTTAVDGRFVPRDARACEILQDGQTVLLFQPIVGG